LPAPTYFVWISNRRLATSDAWRVPCCIHLAKCTFSFDTMTTIGRNTHVSEKEGGEVPSGVKRTPLLHHFMSY